MDRLLKSNPFIDETSLYGLRADICCDTKEVRVGLGPQSHASTRAHVFADVAEAIDFQQRVKKRHRKAGRRYSVLVLPRSINADCLSLSVWVVVQRDLQAVERGEASA